MRTKRKIDDKFAIDEPWHLRGSVKANTVGKPDVQPVNLNLPDPFSEVEDAEPIILNQTYHLALGITESLTASPRDSLIFLVNRLVYVRGLPAAFEATYFSPTFKVKAFTEAIKQTGQVVGLLPGFLGIEFGLIKLNIRASVMDNIERWYLTLHDKRRPQGLGRFVEVQRKLYDSEGRLAAGQRLYLNPLRAYAEASFKVKGSEALFEVEEEEVTDSPL